MDRRGKTEEAVREKKRLTGGAGLAAEERRGRAGRGAGSGWEKEMGRLGPCGRGGEKRGGPRGKGDWAGPRLLGLGCLLLSFFLFFFCTQTIQTIYLNPNKFEFKSYKLNTRKIMLQHECTNNLIL
jgi:hypothetical protein